MKINYTKDQQKVIDVHHKNILVAAAAGSGKTAVLVERIVQMVSDPLKRIDIDHLLVVTFTKAAASEMRERISSALIKRLKNEPENIHLQKQLTLIHHAQITTIDSFCLYILRNNFNEVGLDPSFRVADQGEIKLLEEEVLANVMEQKYQKGTEEFYQLVESFAKNGKDTALEETLRKMRNFAMSYPFPSDWLGKCSNEYADTEAPYLSFAMQYIKDILWGVEKKIQYMKSVCLSNDGPYMYLKNIEQDEEMIENLIQSDSFETLAIRMQNIKFGAFSRKKDDAVSPETRDIAKNIRKDYKEELSKLLLTYFFAPLEDMQKDLEASSGIIASLVSCVLDFQNAFVLKKREMNMIDFSDMEHLALDILIKNENGVPVPTKVAKSYQEYFHEILIDEYQDSNLVQEFLLASIAKKGKGINNRFMVGDVKQSIYRFRLARPDLFMDKFDRYQAEEDDCIRIDLHKNFRSRNEILEASNLIFSQIMQKDLGGVAYDDDAKLNVGAAYPDTVGEKVEFVIADTSKFSQGKLNSKEERVVEARVIAKKIKELVGIFKLIDPTTRGLRPAKYKDIVILLRTYSGWDEIFNRILREEGIPSYVDSKTGYFSAIEVQFVLDFLKVLDNPQQDIPLCGIMISIPFAFSEEDLSLIRIASKERMKRTAKKEKLFEAVYAYGKEGDDQNLADRIIKFIDQIETFRNKVPYEPIHQLIQEIYEELNVYAIFSVLPEGEQRSRNLDMLLEKAINFENTSYRGLFHFNRYIEQLHKYDVDFGEASELEEAADVVQIISIHKSKGLEFPICIVAGMDKAFNMQDYHSAFVKEGDLGVGMEYVDLKKRITKPTIRRNALITKMKMDALGEELRVLYVALTRAKEKLIITAASNKLEKLITAYGYLQKEETVELPFITKINAKSYFELLIAALIRHDSMQPVIELYGLEIQKKNPIFDRKPHIKVEVLGEQDIVEQDMEESKFLHHTEIKRAKENLYLHLKKGKVDANMEERIASKFCFVYPYKQVADMYTKTTVSQLKMDAMEEDTHVMFAENNRGPYLPAFLRAEEKTTGSMRGSAFHKFLELVPFDYILSKAEVEVKVSEYEQNGKLSKEYVEAIIPWKIACFMDSNIATRMIEANQKKCLYKEQPFIFSVPANRVNTSFPEDEQIIIQGIIDVYFEEEGELVILDYKTDYIDSEQELINRYKTQLDYYGEALEKLTGKKVKEKCIYSFALKKEILV